MKTTTDGQTGNGRRGFIKNTAIGLAGLYILPQQFLSSAETGTAGKTSPACLIALQQLIAANTIGGIRNILFFPASCRNKSNAALQPRAAITTQQRPHPYYDQAITASWTPFVYYALQGLGYSNFKNIECSAIPLPNTKRFARTAIPPETAHLIFHAKRPTSGDSLRFHWIQGDLGPSEAITPPIDRLEIEGNKGRISLFISETDTRILTATHNGSGRPLIQTFWNGTNQSDMPHEVSPDIASTDQYGRLMLAAIVAKQTFCLLNSSGLSKFNYPADYRSFPIDLDSNLIFRDEVCHQFLSIPA